MTWREDEIESRVCTVGAEVSIVTAFGRGALHGESAKVRRLEDVQRE